MLVAGVRRRLGVRPAATHPEHGEQDAAGESAESPPDAGERGRLRRRRLRGGGSGLGRGRQRGLVYTLDGLLLMIALTTLVAVASLAVRERVRDLGVMRTLGFTPRQVTSGLVGSHLTVAVVAAVISIPLGIGLYRGVYAMAGGDAADLVLAPWWWLALVPVATAAAVVITIGGPAWLTARASVVEALRYE